MSSEPDCIELPILILPLSNTAKFALLDLLLKIFKTPLLFAMRQSVIKG